MHVLEAERPDRMEEACGVFAVLAGEQPVANLAYFGLYALQHRGQESAGIAVFNEGKVRLHKDMGLVSQVFDQDVLARMPGDLAIGHNRYSTTGSSRVCNAQPVVLMTRLGAFALAHNGTRIARERGSVDDGQTEFTSTTDSELIAFAVQQAVDRGLDWTPPLRLLSSLSGCIQPCDRNAGWPVCRAGWSWPGPLVFGTLGDQLPVTGWWQ